MLQYRFTEAELGPERNLCVQVPSLTSDLLYQQHLCVCVRLCVCADDDEAYIAF